MSETATKEDKTEPASGRRLGEARGEGNIANSRDLNSAVTLFAGAMALLFLAGRIAESLITLTSVTILRIGEGHIRDLASLVARPAWVTGLFCLITSLGAVAVGLIQTKGGFWPKLAMPRFDRFFSGARFGRFFKPEMAADLGLQLVKTVALGAVLWAALGDEFVTLPEMLTVETDALLEAMFSPLARSLVMVMTVVFLLAGMDFAVQTYRFRQRMKMTKDEVKREAKDEDGDPAYRRKRKQKHHEIVRGRVATEVPKADVVVVNPTHIAVALRYRPGEDGAPRVTAKGRGPRAAKIRALAIEHGVPVVQNVALARLLYRRVRVGRTVPAETFKTVAAVLAFVYRALGRTSQHEASL